MLVGTGHTAREFCDGQSLASTGRWLPHGRNPSSSSWLADSGPHREVAAQFGLPLLLMILCLCNVERSLFDDAVIRKLKTGGKEGEEGGRREGRATFFELFDEIANSINNIKSNLNKRQCFCTQIIFFGNGSRFSSMKMNLNEIRFNRLKLTKLD